MLSVAELEERIAAAITALDASAYEQGGVAAAWTESQGWGTDLEGGRSLMHLQFQVATASSSIETRGTRGEPARVLSRVHAPFTYLVRPGATFVTDIRLARDAARDLCRAVNSLDDESGEISVDVLNLGEPVMSADGEVMLIVPMFDIGHEVVL